MAVPYTFANSTTSIPLSQLDNNFATAITIGNTAVQLGNTVTTLNNMTMANVTISSVSTPITAAQGGTGLSSVGSSGNILTSNGTAWVSQAPAAATGNVTIGNTTVNIGGTATTVGNLTLTNATISSVSTPITAAQGGTGASSLTANNVILGNGTNAVQFVAPGTSGNVLASNGTSWVSQAAGGAGSMIYLSTVTAANSATVSVETTFDSTYDVYVITAVDVRVEFLSSQLALRMKSGGTYQTSSYNGIYLYTDSTGSVNQITTTSNQSRQTIASGLSNNTNSAAGFEVRVYNPSGTSFKKGVSVTGFNNSNQSNNAAGVILMGGTYGNSTAAVTGIQFLASTGNIVSGTFRLYGIKNS